MMPAPEQPSSIVRQKSPPNIEFPFASLSEWLIRTDLFFVRNHFPSPHLSENGDFVSMGRSSGPSNLISIA